MGSVSRLTFCRILQHANKLPSVTIILCVFLLSYMYGEGKSNYFKGSILILAYLVVLVGSYFSSFNNKSVNPMDTLALGRVAFRQGFVEMGQPA